MKATVLRVTVDRMCEARTENDILFLFSLPVGAAVAVSDELELGRPVLSGAIHVRNLTRGSSFGTTIREQDVHDLRAPARHGGSRTPTIERLHAP